MNKNGKILRALRGFSMRIFPVTEPEGIEKVWMRQEGKGSIYLP